VDQSGSFHRLHRGRFHPDLDGHDGADHPGGARRRAGPYRARADRLHEGASGKLAFASSGYGQTPFIATELFRQQAGIDTVVVPFKGAAPRPTT